MTISNQDKAYLENLIHYYVDEVLSYKQITEEFVPIIQSVPDATLGFIIGQIYSQFMQVFQNQKKIPSLEDFEDFNKIINDNMVLIKNAVIQKSEERLDETYQQIPTVEPVEQIPTVEPVEQIPTVEPVEQIPTVSKIGFIKRKLKRLKKQTKDTSENEIIEIRPKIKHDPILLLLAGTIFVFIFIGPFYFISGFSAGAMFLGGVLVIYQMWDVRRWTKTDFKSRKHAPGIFSVLLLVLPFAFGGLLAFEGYSLWESAYRSVILWGFTITFWSVMLMIPLALYSKNNEERMLPPHKFPLITILIPAYNEEKVIANTIESTLEIDYPKKEIIIIDDGSKDNTLAIAKQYEKKGVKVLHKENGGKASALNYGTTFAMGEYLAILDSDTLAGRSSLKESIKVFENEHNVGGVAGNVKIRNRVNWITWCQSLEYVSGLQIARRAFDMFGAITIIPGALGVFKTSVLKEAGMYDKDTLVEDFDATIKILKSGLTVRGTTKSLAYTEAPESLIDFYKQRKRWYRGNLQVLARHKDVLSNPRFGFLQKIAYPYMVISMLILPIIGFLMLGSTILAIIEGDGLFVLGSMIFFIILQYLMTAMAVRMDGDTPKLTLFAIFSIFGYKQIQDALMLRQVFEQLLRRKAKWSRAGRIGFVK